MPETLVQRPRADAILFERDAPLALDDAGRRVDLARPDFDPALSINRQRWVMIAVICVIFVLLNGVVCYLINKTLDLEFELVKAGRAIDDRQRIITNGVFMSLIGATVIQTGLVIRGISNFLFREDKSVG